MFFFKPKYFRAMRKNCFSIVCIHCSGRFDLTMTAFKIFKMYIVCQRNEHIWFNSLPRVHVWSFQMKWDHCRNEEHVFSPFVSFVFRRQVTKSIWRVWKQKWLWKCSCVIESEGIFLFNSPQYIWHKSLFNKRLS